MEPLIKNFAHNLEALRDFVGLVAPVLAAHRTKLVEEDAVSLAPLIMAVDQIAPELVPLGSTTKERLSTHFAGKVEVIEAATEGGDRKKFSVRVLDRVAGRAFDDAVRRLAKGSYQEELLYRSALISLVSAVEWFLSGLLHYYFKKFPDAVGGSEKAFSLSDLQSLGSIDDARSYLVSSKVEDVLRGSLEDWIAFLRKQPKLSMGYLDEDIDNMIEIFQRRNLVVHNGGVVNYIYLSKVRPQLRKGLRIGDHIQVGEAYVEEAVSLLEKAFLLVGAEAWRKIEPEDQERGSVFIALAFSHLVADRWGIAESLSLFTMNDARLPERDRVIARINYWIALKAGDRFEGMRAQVEAEDFSAKDEVFSCAHLLLLDRMEEGLDILEKLVHGKKIGFRELSSWPLFRWVRGMDAFLRLVNVAEQMEEGTLEADV